MNQFLLNFSGGFMYFPEDKSAYLPAAIEMVLLFLIVFVTYKWFRRIGKRQADEAKKLEARALQERDAKMQQETNK